jgi:hypothetical protein
MDLPVGDGGKRHHQVTGEHHKGSESWKFSVCSINNR